MASNLNNVIPDVNEPHALEKNLRRSGTVNAGLDGSKHLHALTVSVTRLLDRSMKNLPHDRLGYDNISLAR